jgi:chemotaxis protein CheD
MEVLINEILRSGARRENLEAKAFGGANVIATSAADGIGDRNARFVVDYLKSEGIRLVATDLGGDRARRIYFFPDSGKVSVQRLPVSETRKAAQDERKATDRIAENRPKGSVELF